ncbi:hypothetical protein KP509_01G070000 [Ceratopteris richardii]|nr:hypothetical protein KP509_01G070000 [Ceratopteris richardii]
MSHLSYSSKRSLRSMKSGRFGRAGKSFKMVEAAEPDIIQVFDEHGNDVTPKPLTTLRATSLHERLLQINTDRFSPESERPSIYSRYSMASSVASFTPDTLDNDGADREEGDPSMMRWSSVAIIPKDTAHSAENQRRIQLIYSSIISPRLDQDFERPISVIITESETFEILSLKGHILNNTYENVKDVLDRNARYKKLLQLKVGSANYSDSSAQTLFSLHKSKEVQVTAKHTETEACQANSWDISDTYARKQQAGKKELPDPENRDSIVQRGSAIDVSEDARISTLLVSAGYLEPSTSTTAVPSTLGPRITAGSVAGSRRGTLLGSAASLRKTLYGAFAGSRRGSTVGSVLASKRGSISGSRAGSRRGSNAGSLAPSRKGSMMGNISFSRRASKAGVMMDDPLLSRGSLMEKSSGVGDEGTDALLMAEDTACEKKDLDLNKVFGLLKALEVAERALVQNTMHDKLLFYRDFKPRDPEINGSVQVTLSAPQNEKPADEKETVLKRSPIAKVGPVKQVEWLWDFSCDLTEGRNISCLAWNRASKDLLTIGYGQFEFGSQKDGLIAFWSLKNACYPHATLTAPSGVTALDFSTSNPNLLAVGFYSGNIAIYDVRSPQDPMPIVQSGLSTGKHTDPVWKVQWIDSNSEHGESLVSISTDGNVTQWFLKKELEYVNLMTLKRVASNSRGAPLQPFISRRAAGMCFDFSPRDSSIYLVGTEEGRIHKCSRSYNEQYLQTYVGHTGPVFQVRWSPFIPSLFLSCSSDWTVCLWQEDKETALLVFQSATQSLQDLRWSFTNACVFGTVSDDGHLEIWDLSFSAVRPAIVYEEKRRLSCVLFCQTSPIVVSAGSNGAASIFRMVGFDCEINEADEVQKLRKALASNVNTLSD